MRLTPINKMTAIELYRKGCIIYQLQEDLLKIVSLVDFVTSDENTVFGAEENLVKIYQKRT